MIDIDKFIQAQKISCVINESPMMGKTRTNSDYEFYDNINFSLNKIWALRCNGAVLTIICFHRNSRKLTLKQRYSDVTSIINN